MLRRMAMSGIKVERAAAPFQAGGKEFAEGTYVLRTAQAFRGYLVDLMEPQKYPELRSGTTGPTKRPYDIAGWTLSMQMGVMVDRIDDRFDASLAPVSEFRAEPSQTLDHRENASFLAMADLLARGAPVRWA